MLVETLGFISNVMSKSFRHILRLLLLPIIGFIFALGTAELLLRVSGYRPYYLNARAFEPSEISGMVYELRPGFTGLYAGLPISVNSLGFRGRATWQQIENSDLRLAIVGDSVAFGQGVPENETLAAQLAVRLRNRLSKSVEVINFGVPGYDTCQEAALFKARALQFKPQAAVLIYVENDTDPPSIDVKDGSIATPDVRAGVFGTFMAVLRKWSAAYNFIWAHWQVVKVRHVSVTEYQQILQQKFNENSLGWQRSRRCLNDFIETAIKNSARPVVLPFPVLSAVTETPYPFDNYVQTVCNAARSDGAACFDTLPAIRDPHIRLHVSTVESHPSPEVYSRMAEFMDKMMFLKPVSSKQLVYDEKPQ